MDDELVVLWGRVGPRVGRAIVNSRTYLDGYPTGAGALGTGGESRTQRLAEHHLTRGDRHGDIRRRLEKALAEVADLVDMLAPSNKAQDWLATQADGSCPPGCCQSCFRDNGTRTQARTEGSRMCKWCENWANELDDDMPPLQLVRLHHQGKRIRDRDVRLATGGKHG